MEHEAGVEPACFGFKAQRGYRQPTARVWIRRQESDLRGRGSEPRRHASNPRLNIWQAAKESNLTRSVLETNLRPARDLIWRMAVRTIDIPLRIRAAFHTGSARGRFTIQNGGRRDYSKAMPEGTNRVRAGGRTLTASPSRIGGCGRIRTCTAVTPSRGSSPISTPLRAS